jgi:lipooligosaccharide transport system permease protein
MDSLWAIRSVWLRFFDVFVKSLKYYLVTTFLEPILYLLSFGIGVGSLVGTLHVGGQAIPYKSFIFSGIIAQTVLFQGFFEGAYGGFVRMYYQKIYQSMAITPITVSEVLWGELLWDASKSTLAAFVVTLIGVAFGQFSPAAILPLLPISFAGALLFSSMGLAAAGFSKSIEELSYPQYLLVFPMFLFCGVFYPLDGLPKVLQVLAWVFPLTSILSLVRTVALGFKFEPGAVPIVLAWMIALLWLARRTMKRRLVK